MKTETVIEDVINLLVAQSCNHLAQETTKPIDWYVSSEFNNICLQLTKIKQTFLNEQKNESNKNS